MEGCVFCNFADKGVVVYEDEKCFAAISLNPINKYHVMVIPREHHESLVDLPDELAAHLFWVAKKMTRAVRAACQPEAIMRVSNDDIAKKGYNLVAHFKIHIIPRFANDGVKIDWKREDLPLVDRERIAQEVKNAVQ
jgi:histidine triad (HIT) family protein